MNYTIFILEDNELQANFIKKLVQTYGIQHNISFHTISAHSLQKAYELLPYYQIDIFLLDIALGKDAKNQDGIAFAQALQLQPTTQNKPILFITAYEIHMPYAINHLHCFSFLIKPYEQEDFFIQLDDLFIRMNRLLAKQPPICESPANNSQTGNSIMIKTLDGTYVPLFPNQLIYITSHGRYLTYVTTQEQFQSRQYTMQKLEKLLGNPFIRCHKSYIVNQTYIKNYDFLLHYAHLTTSKDLIPLSRKFRL